MDITRQNYGVTPVELLNDMHFFDNHTIAAHVVWPTTDDDALLAAAGVGVIHNPTSNMKISSGVSPVARMRDAGIHVGLGTDGAASNNDLDMWEEMRLASLLSKVSTMDPTSLPAATVLEMATADGARAIGLDGTVGRLTPGLRADLIQVDLSDPSFLPLYDVVSHLVYVADEQDVTTVVVDGKVLMRDQNVLTIDERQLRSDVERIAERIRAGVGRR
jgi:5-methylthioadenosine/S-adenosylhomocysteine deaminase